MSKLTEKKLALEAEEARLEAEMPQLLQYCYRPKNAIRPGELMLPLLSLPYLTLRLVLAWQLQIRHLHYSYSGTSHNT